MFVAVEACDMRKGFEGLSALAVITVSSSSLEARMLAFASPASSSSTCQPVAIAAFANCNSRMSRCDK